jgi:hypothetical protein
VHCRTEQEAEALKAELRARLAECHLELHPTKTKIVYCRDGKRKGTYSNVKFDFLGYSGPGGSKSLGTTQCSAASIRRSALRR